MESKSGAESVTTLSVKDLPEMDCSCDKYSAYDCNSMSQPPPAYTKPKIPSAAVKIAKIIAVTFLLACFILGFFIVAASYVQTLAKCNCDTTKEIQSASVVEVIPPQARIQEPLSQKIMGEVASENREKSARKDRKKNRTTTTTTTPAPSTPETPQIPFFEELPLSKIDDIVAEKLLIPLSFNLDDIAGQLLDANQRANMNCVVERHRDTNIPEEFLQNLPFLENNLGFVHVIGERMTLNCGGGQHPSPMGNSPPIFPQARVQRPFPMNMIAHNLPHNTGSFHYPRSILPAPFLTPPNQSPNTNTHFTREARSHSFQDSQQHVILPRSAELLPRTKRCSCACK